MRSRAALAAALVVAPPAFARADEKQTEAGRAAPLEVRVIGESGRALAEVPGSGTVVTESEIRRAQPADAAEMLRRVPGLLVRQEQSAGLRLDIGVRGLDPTRSRRVLVLEDGVPVAANPYAEPDLYVAPAIERARAIEVVKGSGSILFGPQTIGGVVNFVTLSLPEERTVSVLVEGGSYGYAKALASYGDSFRGVRYVVQAFHKRSDTPRNEPYDADDMLAKVAFETSSDGEAVLKLSFHDERARSTAVGLTQRMFLADAGRPSLAPDDALQVRRFEASFVHEQRFGAGTTLRTLGYAYVTTRVWRRQDYDRGPVPGQLYERIVGDPATPFGALYFRSTNTIPDRTYDVAGLEPRLRHVFSTGPVVHTLDAGVRFLAESGHRVERAGETPDSDAGAVMLDESHATYAVAAHLQDRIAFRDDIAVLPGVRVEHAQFVRSIGREIVEAAPRDVNVEGTSSDTAVVPGIGIVLGKARAHAFGGFHVGYAPPRIVTAIAATGRDEQLAAEESLQYEAGFRLDLARVLRVEITGFLSNFKNQIIASSAASGTTTELVNAGATRHLGVEGGIVVPLGALARLPLRIDLGGNYTLSRATFVGGRYDGNVLPYAPLHLANGTLDVEHPSGFGGELAVSYVDRQFTDELDTAAVDASGRQGAIDAVAVFDFGVRYRERRTGLTPSLTIKNLFDALYVASRRPDGIFPGSPRQVNAALRWDLR